MSVLLETPAIQISEDGKIVRATVRNSQGLTPEQGAESAKLSSDYLTEKVLSPTSGYQGLIFDVREGPSMFGPKTRQALEGLFARANRGKQRVGVVVGAVALQKVQFLNLCNNVEGDVARVFDSVREAKIWIQER